LTLPHNAKTVQSKEVLVRFNQFSKSSDSGFVHALSSEITPQAVYTQRRDWLKQVAAGAAGVSMAAWASREAFAQTPSEVVMRPGKLAPLTGAVSRVSGANTMEKITTYADASSYNNFYEFGTDKSDPAKYAHTLQTKPWTVEVEGLVKKPGRFDLDALLKLLSLIHI
jgi:sulfoxide reductase catalytic subunit YedY